MSNYIIVWLGFFVIGSLIVSVILDPGIIDDVKDKISNYKNANVINNYTFQTQHSSQKTIKLIPSEMDEYGWNKDNMDSCVALEVLGDMNGISNIKRKFCIEACSWRDMDYSSYSCNKDLFVCFCNK